MDALCAGDREFVYALDGVGSVAWGYPPDRENPPISRPWLFDDRDVKSANRPFVEEVLNIVLVGDGQIPCGNDICYNSSLPGAPVALTPRQPCCIAQETKFPDTRTVRLKSFETAAEATTS